MKAKLSIILVLFAVVLSVLVFNNFNPYINMFIIMSATLVAMLSASYILEKYEK